MTDEQLAQSLELRRQAARAYQPVDDATFGGAVRFSNRTIQFSDDDIARSEQRQAALAAQVTRLP